MTIILFVKLKVIKTPPPKGGGSGVSLELLKSLLDKKSKPPL